MRVTKSNKKAKYQVFALGVQSRERQLTTHSIIDALDFAKGLLRQGCDVAIENLPKRGAK